MESDDFYRFIASVGHEYAFGKELTQEMCVTIRCLPILLSLQDDVGDTPLGNAILKKNIVQAATILKIVSIKNPAHLELRNTSGDTALMITSACDTPLCLIKEMIDSGCKLEKWNLTGKTILTYAIEYKRLDVIKFILTRIKRKETSALLLRKPPMSWFTPIQIAILNKFVEGVRLLCEAKYYPGKYMVDMRELSSLTIKEVEAVIASDDVNEQNEETIKEVEKGDDQVRCSTRALVKMINDDEIKEIVYKRIQREHARTNTAPMTMSHIIMGLLIILIMMDAALG